VVAVASHGKALWYVTRGTGLVSMLLLTGTIALGVLEVNRWSSPRWPRFVTAALHKNVSLLATTFLAVHIVTAVVDSYAPIHWIEVVVPFTSAYRAAWLGLGAVASDLLIALLITSLLRARIGYATWRVIHWAAYACWPIAVVHGLGTGSDTRQPWALALYGGSMVLVVVCVWWRVASRRTVANAAHRLAAFTASLTVPVVIFVFVLAGPLQPGWAARAGTPKALGTRSGAGAPAAAPGTGTRVSTPTGAELTAPFSAKLSGTLSQSVSSGTGEAIVTINGTLSGGATGAIQIVLQGRQLAGGGVDMRSSEVSLGSAAQPSEYTGSVIALSGSQLQVAVRDAGGRTMIANLTLAINSSGGIKGTVVATA
jgi:hypothetical protein